MTEEPLSIDEQQKIKLKMDIAKAIESGILGVIKMKNNRVAYYMKKET